MACHGTGKEASGIERRFVVLRISMLGVQLNQSVLRVDTDLVAEPGSSRACVVNRSLSNEVKCIQLRPL